MSAGCELSIVSTIFRTSPFLVEFHRRMTAAAAQITQSYELIFVNDGTPDDGLEVALSLVASDPHVKVVDLSRNFGHHKAMMTGLEHARGERIFLIDSDLEEDPAWLTAFDAVMGRERADVVYGVQARRKGSWFERATGDLYYRIFNNLLGHPLPRNVLTVRLMTRRYVAQLVRHRDRELCLAALWVITGFKQVAAAVEKSARAERASYSVRQRISVGVNAITSFSNRPLIYIFYAGCAIMGSATLAGGVIIWGWLTHRIGVAGWPSLIVSVWFLGGATILCLGIIGIYLAKVFMETKDRPYTVIRAVYGEREVA
jgi:putative glycosyltransferase